MKKLQKQRILNMIETICEAHEEFPLADSDYLFELIYLCKESVQSVAKALESDNSEIDVVIFYIQEYCNLLQEFVNAHQSEVNIEQLYFRLNNLIESIGYSIKSNILEENYEILFLPYNASMWDSMESIYDEAVKDSRCNVVIMPIPYYGLDKLGNIISINCDSNKFPDNLNITDYKKYDISKKKPDIIFIHNPYDQYNKVTRIFEKYYSDELKKYTDHLVYIPYYVSENKTDEHLCFMPGVRNAWKVFVQSDKVRQQFIKWNPEDKIIAMGSPKIDKIINSTKNKPIMPLEWRNKLAGKKVLFLNTHLTGLLNSTNEFLNKLHYIFQYLAKDNDIAIIWRPHPLSMETAKSISIQLYKDFISLVENFKLMDNTIYDDSPNSLNAIAFSDAYIGDRSSMLTLYKATGKPIYLISNQVKTYLTCLKANINDHVIWLFSRDINALFKMDIMTKNVEYIDTIQFEPKFGKSLFKEVIKYNNNLFLVPSASDYIVVYDIINRKQQSYKINRKQNKYGVKNSNVIVEDKNIYMYPQFYGDPIVIMDMVSYKLSTININYDILDKHLDSKEGTIWGKGVKVDQTYWCPLVCNNYIVKISNTEIEIIKINSKNIGHLSMVYDGEYFWLSPFKGDKIIKWNHNNDNISEIEITTDNGEDILYPRIICYNEKVFFIPVNSNRIIIVNAITNEKNELIIGKGVYKSSEILDHCIYLFPIADTDNIIKINLINNLSECFKIKYPDTHMNIRFVDYYTHYVSDKIGEEHIYTSDFCDLDSFINIVKEKEFKYKSEIIKSLSNNIENLDGTSGLRIWSYIIENI